MAPLEIRPATRADLASLLALQADDALSLHAPGPDSAPYERALDDILADPRTVIYVASRAGAVVGTFQSTLLRHLTGKVAHIEAVRVTSGERGHGTGTAMMRFAIEDARAKGCAKVSLTSQKRRVDAHRFYERLGFVASHVGMKLDLP